MHFTSNFCYNDVISQPVVTMLSFSQAITEILISIHNLLLLHGCYLTVSSYYTYINGKIPYLRVLYLVKILMQHIMHCIRRHLSRLLLYHSSRFRFGLNFKQYFIRLAKYMHNISTVLPWALKWVQIPMMLPPVLLHWCLHQYNSHSTKKPVLMTRHSLALGQ